MNLAGSLLLAVLTAFAVQAPVQDRRLAPESSPDAPEGLTHEQALLDEAMAALERLEYDVARARLTEAADALLGRPGESEDDSWIQLLDSVGRAAWQAQDPGVAKRAFERVLAARSARLPEDDPAMIKAWINLGMATQALGDLPKASEILKRALGIASRVLPEEHSDVLLAKQDLAMVIGMLGDLEGARALEEEVLETRTRILPDDHPSLQAARMNLAATVGALGDLQRARDLEEKVLEVRTRMLPDDHPHLQMVRHNLAQTLSSLGELPRARSLQEKVLEVYTRTLPQDHPERLKARLSLAETMARLGELEPARAIEQDVLEAYLRTFPEDHPDVQRARLSLGETLDRLRDLLGARVLYEQVLEAYTRALPDDHPNLQVVRARLGGVLFMLGDPQGSRALEEKVLEVYSSTLEENHPLLQAARANLAETLADLGETDRARELEEQAIESLSRSYPEDHPELLTLRLNLGATLLDLHEFDAARAQFEQVIEARSRTLEPDHPDLLVALHNLSETCRASGDLGRARELGERVLASRSRSLPDEHPDLQATRSSLAKTNLMECISLRRGTEPLSAGDDAELGRGRERAAALLGSLARAVTSAARDVKLSVPAREAEERCANLAKRLDLVLSAALGYGELEPLRELDATAFEYSEATRNAGIAAGVVVRLASASPRYEELRRNLRMASEALARTAQSGIPGADLQLAIDRRESAERALVDQGRELAGGQPTGIDPDVDEIGRALGDGTAAVAYRRFQRMGTTFRENPGRTDSPSPVEEAVPSLCAFVVRARSARAGDDSPRHVDLVDLGPAAPVEEAVLAWREGLGVGSGRGIGVSGPPTSGDLARKGDALRRLVLDPVLPHLAGATRVIFVLDDVLHLVPFDALPTDAGGLELLGDRFRIETRATLGELLDPGRPPSGPDRLLAIGEVAYDGSEEADVHSTIALESVDSMTTPPAATGSEIAASTRAAGSDGLRDLAGGDFTPLPGTGAEVLGLERLFEEAFGQRAARSILRGVDASRERLTEFGPESRWLHIATHGWFAGGSIRSWKDPAGVGTPRDGRLRWGGEERVRGMSPMVLCGLALSGANLPDDLIGRARGLITAEEIAALDLSRCELAVLSACDTARGEMQRAGQGVASLQKALQIAGARSVITSQWKVPDEATKDLMLDFYRRLWVEREPKRVALWEAKKRLREAKDENGKPTYSTRDWAAWVLTGDPK